MPIETHFLGRWDAEIHHPDGHYPSWFELNDDGTGRFVGQFGSARPIEVIRTDGEAIKFALPPQYEQRPDDLVFSGTSTETGIKGMTTLSDGTAVGWSAKKAPALPKREIQWGPPRSLIQQDLSNWRPRSSDMDFNWSIQDGALVNDKVGSDLVLQDAQSDFKLICEYRYPTNSNSGIYLRGRYEVQILDDFGKPPSWGSSGAIYGFLVPDANAVLPPDQWNRCEIELIGRWVTITLNGQVVINNQEIPGITGGALDSQEDQPGHLFLQGDHGPITFRRLDILEPSS